MYKIIHKNGHYEVYINKRFYCSADSFAEAVSEVEAYKRKGNVYV